MRATPSADGASRRRTCPSTQRPCPGLGCAGCGSASQRGPALAQRRRPVAPRTRQDRRRGGRGSATTPSTNSPISILAPRAISRASSSPPGPCPHVICFLRPRSAGAIDSLPTCGTPNTPSSSVRSSGGSGSGPCASEVARHRSPNQAGAVAGPGQGSSPSSETGWCHGTEVSPPAGRWTSTTGLPTNPATVP
jgi:hypothetical protein